MPSTRGWPMRRVVAVGVEQDAAELDTRPLVAGGVVHPHHLALADSILTRAIFKNCIHFRSTVLDARDFGKCNLISRVVFWPGRGRRIFADASISRQDKLGVIERSDFLFFRRLQEWHSLTGLC